MNCLLGSEEFSLLQWLELFGMIPTPLFSGIAPQLQAMQPFQSVVSSFWESGNVHDHVKSLRETIDLLQAMCVPCCDWYWHWCL